MIESPTMATVPRSTHKPRIICQCLRVTEAEVRNAANDDAICCIKGVMDATGAGSGCTACHLAVKAILAGQCPPLSPSPTWVIR